MPFASYGSETRPMLYGADRMMARTRTTAVKQLSGTLARIAALALLVLPAGHFAAQYTRTPLRTITGTVNDAGREPIRGAVVQIEAMDTLVIQSYETNETGTYHFRNLRSDCDYTLWAMYRGNRSKTYGVGKFDHALDREIPITVVLAK